MIASGTNGIDIYSINSDNRLTFWKTMNASDLNLDTLNVIDIACSEDGKTLYILDS